MKNIDPTDAPDGTIAVAEQILNSCTGCAYYTPELAASSGTFKCGGDTMPTCGGYYRVDGHDVIFKKVTT